MYNLTYLLLDCNITTWWWLLIRMQVSPSSSHHVSILAPALWSETLSIRVLIFEWQTERHTPFVRCSNSKLVGISPSRCAYTKFLPSYYFGFSFGHFAKIKIIHCHFFDLLKVSATTKAGLFVTEYFLCNLEAFPLWRMKHVLVHHIPESEMFQWPRTWVLFYTVPVPTTNWISVVRCSVH